MKFHNLQKASYYEFEDWLNDRLDLTPYQKERLRDQVSYSQYYIYKRSVVKSSLFYRLSILLFIPFVALLYVGLPFTFIFTGTWGYGGGFIEKFVNPWIQKIGL